ncbi:MAG: phosphopantetheine-binding protein, partial [Candidatus Acidiferrales bacterium]
IGELDSEGNLFFRGRKKDVIVTPEGMNVYPEDLEAALRRQPEVRDCAVIGLERNGNAVPCAALLLNDGANGEAVVQRANELLADFQHVRHWFAWPEQDFPRTSTQKPRTNLIAQAAEQHFGQTAVTASGASVGAGATPGSLAELIGRITQRSAAELAPEASLAKDLNLSSLERVELMGAIEDRYQVELNEAKFAAATTVGELEAMLRQPAEERTQFHYPRWAQAAWLVPIRFLAYYLLAWPSTVLLAHPRVRGRERVRNARPPVIIICNHVTYVDIGFVLFALPSHLRRRLAVAMEGERVAAMRNPPRERGLVMGLLERSGYWLMTALFGVFPLPARAGFRRSFAFIG